MIKLHLLHLVTEARVPGVAALPVLMLDWPIDL
jgi:hypothetical protein